MGAALLVSAPRLAVAQSSPASPTGPQTPTPLVASSDRLSATVGGRAQIRDTAVLGPGDDTNEAQVRTVRLTASGHLADRSFRYGLQLAFGGGDFERDSASPIFDAFVELTALRDAQLRVGQFFVPFDRARTVREFALQFVDRPQAVRELGLGRDVGVMLSSTDFLGAREVVGYNVFLGTGDGVNRFGGQDPGPLLVVRTTVRPFGLFDDDMEGDLKRLARPRLAVGGAVAQNWSTARSQSTVGTTFTAGRTDYRHGVLDLVFKVRGLSVLGEVLYRQASVAHLDTTTQGKPVREWTRSASGYVVQLGYLLTSQVEVVGRWEQLNARGVTDPALVKQSSEQGKQIGGGANVYLDGHRFKLQSDYFYLHGSAPGHHQVRVQIDASF